jgi:hypothetical protein
VEQDRVEHGAEHVVLALVESAVPDPDRPCAGVSREVVERRFGEVPPPVDPVHDLHRAVFGRIDVGDEFHELVGLPVEVEPVERLQREGRVAHPGVAVVPVALPARGLGQRRRQRGHGRSGRHIGQPLDRERRPLNRLAEAVVGDPGATEPVAPEARSGRDSRIRLLDILGSLEPFCPGEGAVRTVAGCERMASPHMVALDAEGEVRD